MSLPDLETEADIVKLVDAFYARVNEDELLRPIFNDVAQVSWAHHLPSDVRLLEQRAAGHQSL